MIHLIMTVDEQRLTWLPQFVAHYRNLGIDNFLISCHVDSDLSRTHKKTIYSKTKSILSSLGISWCSILDCKFDAMLAREHHDNIQDLNCKPNDWIVWADIDEFQEYTGGLKNLLKTAHQTQVNIIGGELVDRIHQDGLLAPFSPEISIWDQFPVGCDFTKRILSGRTNKVVCSKQYIKIDRGNHDPIDGQDLIWAEERATIHHFKWDSTVIKRLRPRLTEGWKKRCKWWIQTQRFFDHYERFKSINVDLVSIHNFSNS